MKHRLPPPKYPRYHGDPPMQMLAWLTVYCILGVVFGIALYDWVMGQDTIFTFANDIGRTLTNAILHIIVGPQG